MPLTDNTAKWGVRSLTKFQDNNGIPVGFEYFSTNPNIPAGSLPLFGGEYSRTVYADLWSWVQEQPNYLLTEEEWQAKASANDGNVPYYSSGDGSTTFRVPSLKCWVKGANGIEEVGSFLQAGLPNFDGQYTIASDASSTYSVNNEGSSAITTGVFTTKPSKATGNNMVTYTGNNGRPLEDIAIDASLSNPIYGNSNTVQPKSIVGMWLVKAYGTVSNVGSTDVSAIAQGLTEAETRIGQLENHGAGATVVESYCNGTEWYRLWSDGWIEQGGKASCSGNVRTITLLKSFANTNYKLLTNTREDIGAGYQISIYTRKTTSFDGFYLDTGSEIYFDWYACGMGV